MGYVEGNTYLTADGQTRVNDASFVHELSHACAMYFKQLHALGKSARDGFRRDHEIAETIRYGDGCKLTPAALRGWKKLFAILKLGAGFACVEKIIAAAQGRWPGDKCERTDLCPGSYYEEAIAQLMNLKYDVEANVDLRDQCSRVRDVNHPRQSDLMDCLMQNDPQFRSRAQALGCGKDAIQGGRTQHNER